MFSIVIPLYNKQAFVARTIASVRAQTFADFEAVVVDDGSTDGSAETALAAIGGDPRFRVIRVPNGGVSAARNLGARETGRPWLVFLDADDEWLPGFLQTVHGLVAQHPGLRLAGTTFWLRQGGSQSAVDFEAGEPVSVDYPFFDWSLRQVSPVWTSATAVRRDAFEAAGGFAEDMNIGEDIHLWVRLVTRGGYALAHRPMAIYDRGDPASLSRSLNDRSIRSRLKLIDFLRGCQRQGTVPREYVQAFSEIHFAELLGSRRYREAAAFAWAERSLPRSLGLRHLLRHLARRVRSRPVPQP